MASSLGKMPTTLVWRLISLWSGPRGLALQGLHQCFCGKGRYPTRRGGLPPSPAWQRELLAQHLCDPLPVGAHLCRGLDHERCFHGGCHHVLASLGHVAEQVAQEVHPVPLSATALEHALDRCCHVQVASEISRCVPSMSLSLSEPRSWRQKSAAALSPTAMPSTSGQPRVLTPIATTTALDTT
jgi:hypothetical protein